MIIISSLLYPEKTHFLKTLMLDVRLLDPSTTLGMTSDYARDDGTTAG